MQVLSALFVLSDADDTTLNYMEHNCDIWRYSDLVSVMRKIKQKEEVIKTMILTTHSLATTIYSFEEIQKLFSASGMGLVRQEIRTLCRSLDPTATLKIKLTMLLKFINDYVME